MVAPDSLRQFRSTVDELARLAQDLYTESEDFPAINRNAKRILASVEMLKIGTEQVGEESE